MGLRLLIADDAPFIREVLRHALEGTEIGVVGEACDGQEAIDLALALRPDLIIMDLVMPIKSGIVAANEILAQMPEMRIIACSTVDQEGMVLKALEAGCCNYITKPFEKKVILDRIRSAFRPKSAVDSAVRGMGFENGDS